MEPRPITPEDYPTLCQWWTAHKWDAPPAACLPSRGLIIPNLAAAFLYIDPSSSLAAQEFLVTNPLNTPFQSHRAISTITDAIANLAKNLGKNALFTTCKQNSLSRVLTTTGFIETDTQMIHLIRPL
jgi:hypothetical protein